MSQSNRLAEAQNSNATDVSAESVDDVATLTPAEIAAKLQAKYASMTPDQKLEQIANKLTSIGV